MYTLGGAGAGLNTWVPATHVGDLDWVPAPSFGLAVGDVWTVNQEMEDLCPCFSNKVKNKLKKNLNAYFRNSHSNGCHLLLFIICIMYP